MQKRVKRLTQLALAGITIMVTACDEEVPLRPPPMMAIAIGEAHSCSLTTNGEAFCWGDGSEGQLGTGTTGSKRFAVRVATSTRFASIVAGGQHTCALTADGTAYCWGANQSGQLGSANAPRSLEPRPVATTVRFSALTAGWAHTCGLSLAGAAYCWGRGSQGELGIGGVAAAVFTPMAVSGGLRFQQISAGGRHSCAVTVARAAYCWGANELGQLGTGAEGAPALVPVRVAGSLEFVTISAGYNHSCAADASGSAYCWGENGFGEIGDGGSAGVGIPGARAPQRIVQFDGEFYVTVSAGHSYSCGLRDNAELMCWGRGGNGQLGNAQAVDRPLRDLVHTEPGRLFVPSQGVFAAVDAGGSTHTCGISTSNTAFCWGQGSKGQLGTGEYLTMIPYPVLEVSR
jgi:alpha-tubulin suppressor-like RCC1 family protein